MPLNPGTRRVVEIFFSYSHKDEALRDELETQLGMLRRQGLITGWHDRKIGAGTEWASEIDAHLNTAQIILLLVSPDYIASDYCYDIEMERALERHRTGEARVIPIILRPVEWKYGPFGHLQPLPANGKPITDWPNHDSAFLDVARGIRKIVEEPISIPGRTEPRRDIVALSPPTNPRTIQQRDKVVRDVHAKLTQPDVTGIVLTGIGGVGKSTLAALVRDYAENQRRPGSGLFAVEPLWLTIDPAVTFVDMAETLFEALGKSMPDFGLLAPQYQAVVLFKALNTANRTRLVILDQFENLLDGRTGHALSDRPGVGEWLDAINSQKCACRILLTSRLWPQGTREFPPTYLQEYSVRGLELTEGVELLRKQGGNQGVRAMEAELRAVVESCDGHALALTLLASLFRNRSLSPNTFFQNPAFFPLLMGDMARNLFNHIYTLQLDQLHRDLLLGFSVYREAVPLEAAQAVINHYTEAPRIQVHTALNTLLIQHLLDASDEECYQLHPIVASYVQDHFVEDDKLANQQALRAAHIRAAQYYKVQATISCPPQEQRKRSSDIRPLIEAVWQLCQAEMWRAAYDLMAQEHLFADLIRWGEAAILLELCQLLLPLDKWHPDHSQEALIYNYLGMVYVTLEQVEGGLRYCLEALNISRETEYRKGEGMALDNLGTLYDLVNQRDLALEYYEQALAVREEIRDLDEIGVTLNNLGGVHIALGRPERALAYYEQALSIHREVGDRRGEGTTLNNLGRAYDELGRLERALAYYEQALDIRREMRDRRGEGTTLNNLGRAYDELGKRERALEYYEQALSIRREVGDRRGEGTTLNNIGQVFDKLRQQDKALAYYKQGLNIFREIGDREGEGKTLLNIGTLYFKSHRYDVALACFQPDIFGGLQKSPSRDSMEWLDAVKSKVGKKRFDGLLAKVESQASQIVEQALSTSLMSNSVFWRWKV